MKRVVYMSLIVILLSPAALAETKKLSNETLKEKGYERLEGKSQFKMGCSYVVRSEDRSLVYKPTLISGAAIGFTSDGISYAVPAGNKNSLWANDGGLFNVTTWRNCRLL